MSGKFSFRAALCVIALLGSSVIGVGTPTASAAFFTTVASDSFEGGSLGSLNGQTTGSGFSGGYVAGSGANVIVGSLTTGSPSGTINGGTRLLQVTAANNLTLATRNLTTPITGSVIVGFQFQFHSGPLADNNFLSIFLESSSTTGDHGAGHLLAPNVGLKLNQGTGPASLPDFFARTARPPTPVGPAGNEKSVVNMTEGTSYYIQAEFDKIGINQQFYNRATLTVYGSSGSVPLATITTPLSTSLASDVSTVSRIGIRTANLAGDVLYVDSLSVQTPAVAVVPVPPALALLASGVPFALVYLRRRKTA